MTWWVWLPVSAAHSAQTKLPADVFGLANYLIFQYQGSLVTRSAKAFADDLFTPLCRIINLFCTLIECDHKVTFYLLAKRNREL